MKTFGLLTVFLLGDLTIQAAIISFDNESAFQAALASRGIATSYTEGFEGFPDALSAWPAYLPNPLRIAGGAQILGGYSNFVTAYPEDDEGEGVGLSKHFRTTEGELYILFPMQVSAFSVFWSGNNGWDFEPRGFDWCPITFHIAGEQFLLPTANAGTLRVVASTGGCDRVRITNIPLPLPGNPYYGPQAYGLDEIRAYYVADPAPSDPLPEPKSGWLAAGGLGLLLLRRLWQRVLTPRIGDGGRNSGSDPHGASFATLANRRKWRFLLAEFGGQECRNEVPRGRNDRGSGHLSIGRSCDRPRPLERPRK